MTRHNTAAAAALAREERFAALLHRLRVELERIDADREAPDYEDRVRVVLGTCREINQGLKTTREMRVGLLAEVLRRTPRLEYGTGGAAAVHRGPMGI